MLQEYGPYAKRKTCRLFSAWIRLAGGTVRGFRVPVDEAARQEQARRDAADGVPLVPDDVARASMSLFAFCSYAIVCLFDRLFYFYATCVFDRLFSFYSICVFDRLFYFYSICFLFIYFSYYLAAVPDGAAADYYDELWPLHLVDPSDREQFARLFGLLRQRPRVVRHYLAEHALPLTMQFQPHKLSASGQELGGGALFRRRLGFSGTPSDLLPVEFGGCRYQAGDDARMLHVLTSPDVCAVALVAPGWSVRSLLREIAGRHGNDPVSVFLACCFGLSLSNGGFVVSCVD